MNTFDEIVARRRSIRSYDETKPVLKEELESVIATALEAPSWDNAQTSRYHVVMSDEMKIKLRECVAPQNAMVSKGAGAMVVTTFVKGRSGFKKGEPVNDLGDAWGSYDLGLQGAYFLLKATEMGLDTIVTGLRDADKVRALLEIPEDEIIVSIIMVGHRSKDGVRPKRKAVEEVAKFY